MSYLILGDFNCVKSLVEKQLGAAPTWYELKDFAECCLSLGHHDTPTTGCYYTWYSNSDSKPVWCKLDWVLLNNEWLEAGLHCNAHFNPPGCLSDHSPCIVSILDLPAPNSKPFWFFNMWADHPNFIATVENGWNLNVDGTTQFIICRKLKTLNDPLKAFNNLHFGHISVKVKEADLALQDAQLKLESNHGNAVIRDSLGDFRKKAVFLAEAERHFYYQKAKIYVLKIGDQNTKFFHDMVKRNEARSTILEISKSDDSIITSAADIGQEFIAYYTSLLGTEVQTLPVDNDVFEWGLKLSSEHVLELYRAVTPSQVKQSIFQISDNKVPEPNRYSECFFKRAWNIVGGQVCMAVIDFFRSGCILRQLNYTIIAFVPKYEHSPSVADYRPIVFCNVIYKIFTKIIADRLALAL